MRKLSKKAIRAASTYQLLVHLVSGSVILKNADGLTFALRRSEDDEVEAHDVCAEINRRIPVPKTRTRKRNKR